MSEWNIGNEEKAKAEDIRYLIGKLKEFNDAHAPVPFERKEVRLFARDDDGKIIGGLLGNIGMHCLVIQILWVEELHRSQRLGRRLVAEAEKIAVQSGALQSILETTSFQAPEFYEKLGYSIIFELADAPLGADTIFMQKSLK